MCLFQFWFPQGIYLGVGLLGVFTGDAQLVTAALEPTTFLRPVHFSEKEEPSCLLCLDLNTGSSVMLNGTYLQTRVVRK